MKYLLSFAMIFSLGLATVAAQSEEQEDEIYTVIEEQAEFPGGTDALMKYLSKNIVYPPKAQKKRIEGRVVLRFVVDKSGNISDVTILKDVAGGCGQEAVRVVKSMPKWKPGKQRGEEVNVYFTLPISFKLH